MTPRFLAILILVLLGANLFPHVAIADDMTDELRELLMTHPRMKSAEEDVKGAEQGVSGARSGYYPTASLRSDIGGERVTSPTAVLLGQHPELLRREGYGMSVTENIFDGFRRESGVDGAVINRELTQQVKLATAQSLLFDGVHAYLDVLRGARLIELALNNESTVQRQFHLEDERVERGAGIAVDVLQAKSRLQIAKERRVTFNGQLLEAVSRYVSLFGHAPQPGIMKEPVLTPTLLPTSQEEAERIALKENTQIALNHTQVKFEETSKKSAAADYWPQVDFVARADFEANLDGVIGQRREYSGMLEAHWQIFNGFATRASVARAASRVASSEDQLDTARRAVLQEVDSAWNDLETATERVRLLENGVAIALEVFDARRKLRDSGHETALNVLDAENELYAARINLTAAAFDSRVSSYRLLAAIGRLGPAALGLAMPPA